MTPFVKLVLIVGSAALISVGAVVVYKKAKGSTTSKGKGVIKLGPIVKEARKYIGIKEKTPNKGFEDSDFEKKMKSAGWVSGSPYCATFVRMVLLNVATGDALTFVKKNTSTAALTTYNNLSKTNNFCEKITSPEPDCIVCYQHHTEICQSVNNDGTINVISANSFFSDNKTEGVVLKTRQAGHAIDDDPFLGYIRFTKLS